MQKNLPYDKILQQCKQNFERSKAEQADLKKQTSQVIDKTHKVESHINTLVKEERLLRKDNDEWEYYLKEKQELLALLAQLISIYEAKDHSFEMDITLLPQYKLIQNLPEKQRHQGEDALKGLVHNETSCVKLEALKGQLDGTYRDLYNSGAFWKCIRCNTLLKEGSNEESCVFHPGKLKYYSCRNCGGDEYFTCCNMCRDCNHGCTKGLHKPG